MKTYIGTKVINAKPMNRAKYNLFRGWNLPADENGNDDGYLVEYTDGGKPKVEWFNGYISWSPKEQFEKSYIEFKVEGFLPHQQRVIAEKAQLDERLAKLNAFMTTSFYESISEVEKYLMKKQSEIMLEYSDIIHGRIVEFKI